MQMRKQTNCHVKQATRPSNAIPSHKSKTAKTKAENNPILPTPQVSPIICNKPSKIINPNAPAEANSPTFVPQSSIFRLEMQPVDHTYSPWERPYVYEHEKRFVHERKEDRVVKHIEWDNCRKGRNWCRLMRHEDDQVPFQRFWQCRIGRFLDRNIWVLFRWLWKRIGRYCRWQSSWWWCREREDDRLDGHVRRCVEWPSFPIDHGQWYPHSPKSLRYTDATSLIYLSWRGVYLIVIQAVLKNILNYKASGFSQCNLGPNSPQGIVDILHNHGNRSLPSNLK